MAKTSKKPAKTTEAKKPFDVYQNVTDSILADLESGVATWAKPWKSDGKACIASGLPLSLYSRKAYRGINIMILLGACAANGWSVPAFATFKQISEMGGKVLPGSKATYVYYMQTKLVDAKTDEEKARADENGQIKIFFQKGFAVLNIAQTEGLDVNVEDLKVVSNLPEDMGEIVDALSVDLRTGGDKAFYSPALDFVGMPKVEAFEIVEAYKATLLHEVTHWTGHGTRMNRKMEGGFGSQSYAYEELVAELGAAFLCAELGIAGRLQHAEYIGSWISLLKGDKRAFFRAASEAQKAVDWIREKVAAIPVNDNDEIEEMREAA
ncbi:hypothetical protein BB934_45195 (plasmid) [Microvirga ossetica]|uniref:Antirestriction protein ArdC n=1 Tax=Microvirga ossetica TaxID=1882682 RepID=A0A1B2EZS9_9HYPH|nr:zincin-like metallopeptidase domain-containing protein [Microvirga ossetica]ANY85418.1 hypothetical protein BB934_45195 [Microvirga ossetica]